MGKSTGMVYLLLHVTSYSVAVSQYALSFGAYLSSIVPSINQHIAAMVILTLFYAMNLVGTKSAAVLNKVMSIALFGGLAVVFVSKNFRLALAPLLLMLVLFIFVPALNASTVGIMVPVGVIFSLVVARILYKKGLV